MFHVKHKQTIEEYLPTNYNYFILSNIGLPIIINSFLLENLIDQKYVR